MSLFYRDQTGTRLWTASSPAYRLLSDFHNNNRRQLVKADAPRQMAANVWEAAPEEPTVRPVCDAGEGREKSRSLGRSSLSCWDLRQFSERKKTALKVILFEIVFGRITAWPARRRSSLRSTGPCADQSEKGTAYWWKLHWKVIGPTDRQYRPICFLYRIHKKISRNTIWAGSDLIWFPPFSGAAHKSQLAEIFVRMFFFFFFQTATATLILNHWPLYRFRTVWLPPQVSSWTAGILN